jgi:hypothetical protein
MGTMRHVLVSLLAFLTIVLPTTVSRAVAQSATTRTTTGPATTRGAGALTAELDEGVVVEWVGIASSDRPGEGWWAPDGSPLAQPPAEVTGRRPGGGGGGGGAMDKWPQWTVALQLKVEPLDRDVSLPRISVVPHSTDGNTWIEGGGMMATQRDAAGHVTSRTLAPYTLVSVRDQQSVDLRVAIAGGDWEVMEAIDPAGKTVGHTFWVRQMEAKRRPEDGQRIEWGLPAERGGATVVESFDTIPDFERQMVAIDVDGKEHPSHSTKEVEEFRVFGDATSRTRGVFGDLPLNRVARVELRGRRLSAAVFEKVSLRRGGKTTPAVTGDVMKSGPADRIMEKNLVVVAQPLEQVLRMIEEASGAKIDVHWKSFAEYQKLAPTSEVEPLALSRATPITAVRAAVEAAGGRDFTVVVSADGKTIRVDAGAYFPIRGDNRATSVRRR